MSGIIIKFEDINDFMNNKIHLNTTVYSNFGNMVYPNCDDSYINNPKLKEFKEKNKDFCDNNVCEGTKNIPSKNISSKNISSKDINNIQNDEFKNTYNDYLLNAFTIYSIPYFNELIQNNRIGGKTIKSINLNTFNEDRFSTHCSINHLVQAHNGSKSMDIEPEFDYTIETNIFNIQPKGENDWNNPCLILLLNKNKYNNYITNIYDIDTVLISDAPLQINETNYVNIIITSTFIKKYNALTSFYGNKELNNILEFCNITIDKDKDVDKDTVLINNMNLTGIELNSVYNYQHTITINSYNYKVNIFYINSEIKYLNEKYSDPPYRYYIPYILSYLNNTSGIKHRCLTKDKYNNQYLNNIYFNSNSNKIINFFYNKTDYSNKDQYYNNGDDTILDEPNKKKIIEIIKDSFNNTFYKNLTEIIKGLFNKTVDENKNEIIKDSFNKTDDENIINIIRDSFNKTVDEKFIESVFNKTVDENFINKVLNIEVHLKPNVKKLRDFIQSNNYMKYYICILIIYSIYNAYKFNLKTEDIKMLMIHIIDKIYNKNLLKADKLEADKLEADKLEADKLEADKLEADKLEADKLKYEIDYTITQIDSNNFIINLTNTGIDKILIHPNKGNTRNIPANNLGMIGGKLNNNSLNKIYNNFYNKYYNN